MLFYELLFTIRARTCEREQVLQLRACMRHRRAVEISSQNFHVGLNSVSLKYSVCQGYEGSVKLPKGRCERSSLLLGIDLRSLPLGATLECRRTVRPDNCSRWRL